MQAELLTVPIDQETAWLRAALRECIEYGEHGDAVEVQSDGKVICFNCGSTLR